MVHKCYPTKTFVSVLRMLSLEFLNIQKKIQEHYVIDLCFLLAKFHIHKQKCTGSKPLFSFFKVDLDKYAETIQNSAHLKAVKTVSLHSPFVSS